MQQQKQRRRFFIGVLALSLLTGAGMTASPAQAVTWPRALLCGAGVGPEDRGRDAVPSPDELGQPSGVG